jgi:HlyD family secretion protein
MIKNALGSALLVVLAVACSRSPPVPPGLQGLVEYDERIISFEVPGRVQEVPVSRGDLVDAGQVLAQLDPTIQQLTLDTHKQEAKAAQADLSLLLAGTRREDIASEADDLTAAISAETLAKTTAERTRALVSSGSLSQAELDRAEADLQRATAERKATEQRLAALRNGPRPQEIARARARLDQANAQLALDQELLVRHVLRSKEPGEVLDVTSKPGELAAVGTPAVTVADTAHPYVDVFAPEGELQGIRPGAKAEVRVDATSAPFPGTVEYVSPETEFTPKFLFSDRERPHLVVRVRVRIQDPDRRMHAGVPAFARIVP